MVNIYLVLLIFVTIITFDGIKTCNRSSPHKIKIFSDIVYFSLFFRFLSLMLLFFVNDLKYLFFLKPLFFINYLVVPAAAVVVIYILMRNDKLNFTYSFIVLGIFTVLYITLIYKFPTFITTSIDYGYITDFYKYSYVNYGYFVLMAGIMISCIHKFDKFADKFGINICIGAILVTLIEIALCILNIRIFPHIILSDICWILTLNYSISKFKKYR